MCYYEDVLTRTAAVKAPTLRHRNVCVCFALGVVVAARRLESVCGQAIVTGLLALPRSTGLVLGSRYTCTWISGVACLEKKPAGKGAIEETETWELF